MGGELRQDAPVNARRLDADALAQQLRDDPAAAIAALRDAARADDAEAQAWLGQLHLDGNVVPRDAAEAHYWFQRAAHAGVPMAMNMLGRCCENGWGVAVDFPLAAVWYRRAAAHNLDWAIYNLAHMHWNGRGMAADRVAAFALFRRAAALGHARAMHFLGQFHEHGWETPVNLDRAFDLYRQSAELGDYRGLCSWASVLAGMGRVDEAVPLIERAIPLAPTHYLGPLAAQLRPSAHVALHRLAIWIDELSTPRADA
ncbi:MAG: sel1 repeat family protein [Rhodanobacter sp.]|nr:sel1 repeat family protein [Rhodanobacter sp.]